MNISPINQMSPLELLSFALLSGQLWSDDSVDQDKIAECCSKVIPLAAERGLPYFQALEALAKTIVAVEEEGTLVFCSDLGLAPEIQKDLVLVKKLLWAKKSDACDIERNLQEARERKFPKTLLARCGNSEVDDVEIKKYEEALHDDCTICLQRHREEDIYKTACGHFFHADCIKRWNQEKKVCPICNDDMNMTRQGAIWQEMAKKIEEKRGHKRKREETTEIIDVDTCTDYEYAKMVENAMKRENDEQARQLREDEELARKLFYEG